MFVPNAFRPFWQPNSRPLPPVPQLESLSRKLDTAEKKIVEYAQLIASLYAEVKRYEDIICLGCREKISLATASSTGIVRPISNAVSALSGPATPNPRQTSISPSSSSIDLSSSIHDHSSVSPDAEPVLLQPTSPSISRTTGISHPTQANLNPSDWSVEYNSELKQSVHEPPAMFVPNAFRPFGQPNSRAALPLPPITQLESLFRKLDTAEKKIVEYAQLIASLYAEVKRYEDIICQGCRENISLVTASSRGIARPVFNAVSALSGPTTPDPRQFSISPSGIHDQSTVSIHPPSPPGNTELHSVIVTSTSANNSQGAVAHFSSTISPTAEPDLLQPASPSISGTTDISRPTQADLNHSDWSVEYNPEFKQSLHLRVADTLTFKDEVCCVTFSRDGKYLAIGLWDGTIHVYNMVTGSKTILVKRFPTVFYTDVEDYVRGAIWTIQFNRDNTHLATVGGNAQIDIWEIGRRRVCATFQEDWQVGYLDVSPNGRLLVSASLDYSVSLWNMRDGSRRSLSPGLNAFVPVMSVAFSPDGRLVAAGMYDATLQIWDVRTGQMVADCWVADDRSGDLKVTFTPDGKGIATAAETLQCWEFGTCKDYRTRRQTGISEDEQQLNQIFEVNRHTEPITDMSFTLDNRYVVSSSRDHTVCLWDARNGDWVCTLKGHANDVWTVDFSPAGRYMASGGDCRVRLWTY